jgi:hypothetical protein
MDISKEPGAEMREQDLREQKELEELLPLLRLLLRDPPEGHDFKTCAICQRYGITSI